MERYLTRSSITQLEKLKNSHQAKEAVELSIRPYQNGEKWDSFILIQSKTSQE